MEQRDADYAVWVVPSEDLLPGHGAQLREVNGDKLFVVFDPEDGSRLALEVAYSLARARTLMAAAGGDGLDAGALRTEVERALAAMDDVRRIKSQLTARGGRDRRSARGILDDDGRPRARAPRAGRRARGRRDRRRPPPQGRCVVDRLARVVERASPARHPARPVQRSRPAPRARRRAA